MRNIFRIGLGVCLIVALFLSASPVYADDPPDEDSNTVVDVEVDGELKADIAVTGPAELNVEARGPSEVDINTDDQVDLNVEAIEPSEVTVNGKKLVPIVAGAIPALGFLSFFLLRRRNQRG